MSRRAHCFEIVMVLSRHKNPDSDENASQNKPTIYQFTDPVLKKEWTFTVVKKKDDGKYSLTLKIDHADKILIKLDLFYGECEEYDGYCTSFKPKGYYRNTWIAELDIDYPYYCLVMKCEMRVNVKIDDYPKPKMDSFLNAELFSDVKIISSDNKAFFGHRCILAGASYEFKDKFTASEGKSEKKEIVLDDVDSQTLDDMLKFIYTGKFEATKVNEIESLLMAAWGYGIHALAVRCIQYLDQNYSKDNVVDVLILANGIDETLLKNCIWFIKLHSITDTVRRAIRNAEINGSIFLKIVEELKDEDKFSTVEIKPKP